MTDPFHDAGRFGVVRHSRHYAVIDKQNGNREYSRHRSRIAAHAHAERLNDQHRAEAWAR